MDEKLKQELKQKLSSDEFEVIVNKGTERPHTGAYNDHFIDGDYTCKACGETLFNSDSKFNAHCGWPSFDSEIEKGKIKEVVDKTHGMIRTEVVCNNCGGHLGHVFNDGPTDTGLRYCINSVSIDFDDKK